MKFLSGFHNFYDTLKDRSQIVTSSSLRRQIGTSSFKIKFVQKKTVPATGATRF